MPFIQIIVSQVMNLKPQLIDSLKDEEDVKTIARLFGDIGDSYVELIATGMILDLLIIVNLQVFMVSPF
ncbi:putative armadillo-like helical protein [Helianthus debilis subsp. tardiflorus]